MADKYTPRLRKQYDETIVKAIRRGIEEEIQAKAEVRKVVGRDEATDLNDLLLPVVKGYGSEKAYELLASSLQVLGGSGFTQDYPVEQYLRDSKIDTLYEGTTTIQGMDLFFRKVVRDQGRALGALTAEVQEFSKAGGTLVASGTATIAYGTARYRRLAAELRRGSAPSAGDTSGPTLAAVLLLLSVLVATVVLSIVAHGLTANPLSAAFARRRSG